MFKDNQDIAVGKKGMNRDSHPSNLSETEYPFALNANNEDSSGSGYPFLQNEHSNILCSRFKEGFKVIGYKHDLNIDRTYFFLTNPETGVSEIGYISSIQNISSVEDIDLECGCNIKKKLGTPLEEQEQEPTCEYVTILSDECDDSRCLNFSINHTIKDNNIQIKSEKCGKTLYWTDNYNPPRYLELDNLEQYKYVGIQTCDEELVLKCEECDQEEYVKCPDCDKLRIFPLFEKPCIAPISIQYGGNLKAGVYEFLLAYCDKQGNEITQYYSITNSISISDENRTVLDQTELAYRTNLGIRLGVSDLDEQFGYYKVAVIQRADVSATTSYFIESIHPTTDTSIVYYTEEDKERTSLNHLLAVKPTYTRTGIMTSSNGYLFHGELTAEKEYNLQPVVNLMGAFLRWQTVKAHEDLYKDGVNNSLHRGYMRDEVYPFSIRFYTSEGFETANFILPNRPPTTNDLLTVNNTDSASVLAASPNCSEQGRTMRWQYYNTASVLTDECTGSGDVPTDDPALKCKPIPYQVGKFGYWESTEVYSSNFELYDSSTLQIHKNDVPVSIKSEFEEYFSNGIYDNYYVLNDYTKLACEPIRHYKFPDFCVSPFMSTNSDGISSFQESYIYPIGVTISEEVIDFFLNVAVMNSLITEEQKNKIEKYEIFRGNRTLHKGIVAKGLAYDMYKYNEDGDNRDIWYPNYPYNDLGEDDLHYTDNSKTNLIQHPFNGSSNNKFTFHSPDTHFHKPSLPTETNIEAYQFGDSEGRFAEVEGHSKWVILAQKAFNTAWALGISEAVFELVALYGDFRVQNAIAGDRAVTGGYGGNVGRKTDVSTEVNVDTTGESDTTNIGMFMITGYSTSSGTMDFQSDYGGNVSGTNTTTGEEGTNYDNYGTTLQFQPTAPDDALFPDKTVNTDGLKYLEWHENQDDLSWIEKVGIMQAWLGRTGSKALKYRHEWLEVFRNNGQPQNFAFYYTSQGFYNYALCNTMEGDKLRGLVSKKYLRPGRWNVPEVNATEPIKINNVDRESSVFLSFGDNYNINYMNSYTGFDQSRFESSDTGLTYGNRSPEIQSPIASPYVSLKNYIPNQYGDIEGIKWLPTGFCGHTSTTNLCSRVFGGDIFISRFSLKRKIPMFLVTAVDLADLTPFNYYPYRNIGHPVYDCDYDVTELNEILSMDDDGFLGIMANFVGSVASFLVEPYPDPKSKYNFDELKEEGFYIDSPTSKFYLYYYGIPQFLVESEINCNYRYARKELHENFYPNVGDYVDWTQEKQVSIKKDNQYNYNDVYSKNTTMVGTRMLPSTYEKELYDCLYDAPNGVIYSLQDTSEQDITDPWLVYKPLDFYQFPTSLGKLIDLKDIESAQILGRFESQVILFNAIDVLRERLTPQNQELGTGGIFATRPLEFKKTDLGYAGTQHKTMVSCEFGHFWVDAKRGQVFQVDQNGKNLKEITIGLRNWFKEQLPFKILKGGVQGLLEEHLDQHFKGLGLTMGWDSRYKRVFLTKKDYVINEPYVGRLTYEEGEFYFDNNIVALTDRVIFTDASFTLAFNPLPPFESWLSYYSFEPDYYIPYHNYFQTGLNYSTDITEQGLWSHLLSNKTFQVFYGKKYPWTLELPVKEGYVNKVLKSVEYWMDTRRYHAEFDYAENRQIGFNKAWIYNQSQNSGQLNLITEEKNNLRQRIEYPKLNNGTTDILATEQDHRWTFNYFYNRVRDELNNNPIWVYDENAIDKTINLPTLQYNQVWQDRLRGDWMLLRLTQDNESRFKQIFKWVKNNNIVYTGV